jgi:hypothetical protein
MDRAAKELRQIRGWLQRVDEVVARGKMPTSPTTSSKRPATR